MGVVFLPYPDTDLRRGWFAVDADGMAAGRVAVLVTTSKRVEDRFIALLARTAGRRSGLGS